MEFYKTINADGSEAKIIRLSDEEVYRLCKPGLGANTCVWLVMGECWECLFYCRNAVNLTGQTLEDLWKAGDTVAKRDGCDEIKSFIEE